MPTQWTVKRAPETDANNDRKADNSTLNFIVIADVNGENVFNARNAISAALSVPKIGEVHPYVPNMFCLSRNARQRAKSNNVFDVVAQYTSDFGSGDQNNENPLLRGVRRRVTFQDTVEPYAYDAENNPSLNSAYMMFDPLPVREVSRPILEVSQNVISTSVGELYYYTNKVNSDIWNGWYPGEVRLKIIGGDEQEENGVRFVNVTYQLLFKETQEILSVHADAEGNHPILEYVEGWDDAILSQGLWERVEGADGFKLWRIRDDSNPDAVDYDTVAPEGEKLTDPQLLDEDGRILLTPGESLSDSLREPSYIVSRPYKRMAFTGFIPV